MYLNWAKAVNDKMSHLNNTDSNFMHHPPIPTSAMSNNSNEKMNIVIPRPSKWKKDSDQYNDDENEDEEEKGSGLRGQGADGGTCQDDDDSN
jgi:hypothetical protein